MTIRRSSHPDQPCRHKKKRSFGTCDSSGHQVQVPVQAAREVTSDAHESECALHLEWRQPSRQDYGVAFFYDSKILILLSAVGRVYRCELLFLKGLQVCAVVSKPLLPDCLYNKGCANTWIRQAGVLSHPSRPGPAMAPKRNQSRTEHESRITPIKQLHNFRRKPEDLLQCGRATRPG